MRWKEILSKILAENCGQTYEQVLQDIDRDKWMSAQEGVAYGIIDEVLISKKMQP